MQILRAADYTRSLWKNGGGETREIAVFPTGAGIADFDWRISMALVASDGPFSIFPGVERTLTILSGGPMELAIEGLPPVRLDARSDPLSFPADSPVSARLAGPPVTDLNVMTRRAVFMHQVRVVEIESASFEIVARGSTAIFCVEGSLSICAAEAEAKLAVHDCCLLAPDECKAVISGEGKAAVVTISPSQTPSG